jgi:hypothetical protein
MIDVTNIMNEYRECSRNLWNTHFSPKGDSWDLHCSFESIRKLLFRALVADEIVDGGVTHSLIPLPVLRVVPSRAIVPLLVAREEPGQATAWRTAENLRVPEDDIELEFIDYFDWSSYPIKDFRFYQCRIVSFPGNPEYEGWKAMLEVYDAKVFYDSAAQPSVVPAAGNL